jgi:hypothetical protein
MRDYCKLDYKFFFYNLQEITRHKFGAIVCKTQMSNDRFGCPFSSQRAAKALLNHLMTGSGTAAFFVFFAASAWTWRVPPHFFIFSFYRFFLITLITMGKRKVLFCRLA